MRPDAMILVFWMLSFKPTFSLSSFTFIKRLFSSSFSAIRVVSSASFRMSSVLGLTYSSGFWTLLRTGRLCNYVDCKLYTEKYHTCIFTKNVGMPWVLNNCLLITSWVEVILPMDYALAIKPLPFIHRFSPMLQMRQVIIMMMRVMVVVTMRRRRTVVVVVKWWW